MFSSDLIIFAGHFAIDTIIRFKQEYKPTLGGSVTYCSLALKTYIPEARISVISNLGRNNFDSSLLDQLKNKNIDLSGLKWFDTDNTNFVLDYFNHSRTLTLKSKSPDLEFKHIPENFLNNPPAIIVLVPLCNEISYNYVSAIKDQFPDAIFGIDLQGFIRKIDNQGVVSIVPDTEIIANMNQIIGILGEKLILKGSEEEMKLLSGKEDLFEVMEYFNEMDFKGLSIMTLGDRGSMISKFGSQVIIIPAYEPVSVADETGAGDVYFAIFLHEFLVSDKSWEAIGNAGHLASAAASFLIQERGPTGFETKDKILERVNNKNYIKKG